MTEFVDKLIHKKTNGMDLTLLTLADMFDLKIVVLLEDYLWKSAEELDITKFDIYLILLKDGRFMSVNPNKGFKVVIKLPQCCKYMFILSSDSMAFNEIAQRNADIELRAAGYYFVTFNYQVNLMLN